MSVLPKKQKQMLIMKLLEKIIEIIPAILKVIVVSKIGTYLGWNPEIIVIAIAAVAGDDLVTINFDSKKTN